MDALKISLCLQILNIFQHWMFWIILIFVVFFETFLVTHLDENSSTKIDQLKKFENDEIKAQKLTN
jgi:hypothetical protein